MIQQGRILHYKIPLFHSDCPNHAIAPRTLPSISNALTFASSGNAPEQVDSTICASERVTEVRSLAKVALAIALTMRRTRNWAKKVSHMSWMSLPTEKNRYNYAKTGKIKSRCKN